MTPERWRQIAHLFDGVLACEPPQRAAFLAERCDGDDSMRQEVEFLVQSYEREKASAEGSASPADDQLRDQISKPANSYQAYQLSRYYYHNVSFPDLEKSRFWLEESLRFDEDFAPAHIALAEQCVMEAITGLRAPDKNFPLARAALRRAFELESDSAELYMVAGFVDLICDWNFAGAERNVRRALELNQHHAFAHKYLGEVLMFQGRMDEAVSHLREAQRIAPMNLHVGIILTISYFLARDYQSVITQCEQFLDMYPSFVPAAWMRCWALEQTGRAGEALVEYEKILREPGGEIALRYIGYAYALVGERENALKIAAQLDKESRWPYLSPTHQAQIYAALDEPETAFSYLEKGLTERDPWMLWIATDPRFDKLRSYSRFDTAVGKVGLRVPLAAQTASPVSSERWLRIDELFHRALVKNHEERARFLVEQCEGDESLRLEVESLLASYDEAQDFIEAPPGDIAAQMFGAHESKFEAGQQIGNYQIVRHLGSGGMGEVYLADDLRLNRKVALKLLPSRFTGNSARVHRFEREARAASALNHPNIVTIHEIGQSNSTHFIATEFIDGKTLRQLIDEKPLTLRETLNVVIQVANALMGAHSAGIVHRDIKPENIMIREDGYVKILDFGLAKLNERHPGEPETESPTLLQSNPGLVMGTVQYMSPEQARGRKVDTRTDIWSLGIVLYELLAGRVPFSGETPSHVMVSLMEDEPASLTGFANVPPELSRIVARALRKNSKERYESARQMASELKHLKRDLEFETLKEILEATPGRDRTEKRIEPGVAHTASTVNIAVAQRTFSGEYLETRLTRTRKAMVLGLAGLIVTVMLAVGFTKLLRRNRAGALPTPFQTVELLRLTNSGKVTDAAVSPDGKFVAYVTEQEGKQSIWLRHLGNASDTQIVPPAATQYYGGTFSPDGADLYYVALAHNNSIGVLYRVPAQGGEPAKVILDVDGPIALSPDGKQLAFTRGSSTGERALIIAGTDGSAERKLATRVGYNAFAFNGPAWSPDGASIACGAAYDEQDGRHTYLVAVNVSDGSIRQLSNQKWKTMGRISWLRHGQGLIFTANKIEAPTTYQLWYLPYPNGEPQRITRDLQDYSGVTVSADSATLVSKQSQTISQLWIVTDGNPNLAKPILFHKVDDNYDPFYYSRTRFSWTPDGQIVYTSIADGNSNIWMMNADGTGHKQLTNERGENTFPLMTPDSRHVVYISNRGGFVNLWRMDSDGRNQAQLTTGEDDSWAWSSPDSRWIVYHSGNKGFRTLWRVSTDGKNRQQLTDYPSVCPVVSPDGRWISFYYRIEPKAPWKLGIVPFDGGRPVKSIDIPEDVEFRTLVRWTPDGLSLAYIVNRDGVSNIWAQPLDGSAATPLTNFTSDQIFWFDWSPDRRHLGISRGTVTSDVVMIKDLAAANN